MARDVDSLRRQHEADDKPQGLRSLKTLGRMQRVAHAVLPVAIALSVLLAYQTRWRTDEPDETTTQGLFDTSEVPPDNSATGSSQETGGEADRPGGSDDENAESQLGEFSPAGPAPAPEAAPTDTLAVSVEINWSLGSAGSSTSEPLQPLNGAVRDVELPNYDSDRDDDPGLTLQIGGGLDEQDPAKIQRWIAGAGDVGQVDGSPTLELWLAAKDFDTDKSGRVIAGLYECSTTGDDCSLLADGDAAFTQASFGADFGRVTVNMTQISTTVAPDRALLIKLAVAESSEADLWVAYGTTTYRTFLSLR